MNALAARLTALARAGDLDGLTRALAVGKSALLAVREALSEADNQALVRALLTGLESRSARLRFECAHALDRFGDASCRAPLVALIDDPVPKVRWMALHALSCDQCKEDLFGDDEDVRRRIAERALADPSVQVRRHAATALGHARGPTAIVALKTLLAQESDAAVVRNARWALEQCRAD